MKTHHLTTPLSDEAVMSLRAGDRVLLSGTVFTARDAAHKRICDCLTEGKEPPVDLNGQIVYFCGPAPAKPGRPIGSAGPTTSYRMDAYSPTLIDKMNLKGMIGKGGRSDDVVAAMREHHCVYFAATGGAAALIAQRITAAEIVCYEDLGTEAVRRLTVKDLPVVVAIDCHGGDLYAR